MAPYAPPTNAFYSEVPIPVYVNTFHIMKNLYRLTERSGCQYMWVDHVRRVVEIWGQEDRLARGIALTRRTIAAIAHRRLYRFQLRDAPESMLIETKVYTWKDQGFVNYLMVQGDRAAFFEYILSQYPKNPFCTTVRPNGVISRLVLE
jgi:hypothetical protein